MSIRVKRLPNKGTQTKNHQPRKIGPATPYDFEGSNMTAYGGLLPVATMLEKLGFRQLVEETCDDQAADQGDARYPIHSGDGAGLYVGFSRLHHMRFLQREPMLTGILGVCEFAAEYLLAFSGFAPPGGGRPTVGGSSGACDSEYGKQPT